MELVVSKDHPPGIEVAEHGVMYWERSADPWHPDAMNAALIAEGITPLKSNGKPREQGWMAIEWTENPVGFVPDGHKYEAEVVTEYNLHTNGLNANVIAERKPNSLRHARWFQRHLFKLTLHDYSRAELSRAAANAATEYMIVHTTDMEDFLTDLHMVSDPQYPHKGSDATLNGKAVFLVAVDEVNTRILKQGTFITAQKREGKWPNNTSCFA